MSTSFFERAVRFRSKLLDGDEPFDTAEAFTAANNILHLSDEAAQVRVACTGVYALPLLTYTEGNGGSYTTTAAVYQADRAYSIFRSGMFYLHQRADGSSYPLRIRIAARSPAAQSITFRATVSGSLSYSAVGPPSASDSHIAEWTTSSSTAAWLTGDLLELSQPYIQSQGMLVTDGSVDGPVRTLQGCLHIYVSGATTNQSFSPAEVSGVYLAEYIGL